MKLIIGIDDGIILDAKRCVLVDDSELGEADRALLDNGTEAEAIGVAYRIGKSLHDILAGCGWGDLHYANSIAYSPSAIRYELTEKVNAISEVDEDIASVMRWGLTADDATLNAVGEIILADESVEVWGDYFSNIILALSLVQSQTITESETVK